MRKHVRNTLILAPIAAALVVGTEGGLDAIILERHCQILDVGIPGVETSNA